MRKILTERTSRQAQFNFAKRVLQNAVRSGAAGLNGYPSQGLFFFYDNEQFFRISLVSGEMEGRKFKFNEAKRQSFYINPDRPNNIAKSRLSESIETYADLKKAFSVETLTKEFYGKLFEWYEWAMKPRTGVTFPNDDSTPDDDKRYNNESIIRLITRLMFTWFIRQRDMVRAELFTVEGVKALLKNFDSKSMEDDNYYRCILQNLFFATFNCQPEKRKFIQRSFHGRSDGFGVKTLYRYEKEFKDAAAFKELVKKTPFLNCALFDCLDRQQRESEGGKILLFDGFSDTRKRQAHVPNGLFFHPEKGIIPLFDTYEFTIDENNADDADVALDPELLGKVFENLLGAFNPETRETARKATGSFYTPREIVDYMVEESLKNHIKTKVPRIKDAWLAELFDKTAAAEKRELPFDDEIAAEIRERILKGDITKLVINYSLNCRNSPFQNLPGLREVNFPIAAGPLCASLDGLFFRCRELVSVRSIDFGKAKSAQCLFWCCGNLRAAPECDVSGLTDANSMFEQCQRLREARSLNFAQARDVHSMFRGCSLLENVSGLRMPEAADAHSLFEGCVHLAEVPDLGIRKGADVRDIFRGCIRLQNRKV